MKCNVVSCISIIVPTLIWFLFGKYLGQLYFFNVITCFQTKYTIENCMPCWQAMFADYIILFLYRNPNLPFIKRRIKMWFICLLMQTIYESQFTRILSNMFLDTREVQGNDDICAFLKSLVKLYVKYISYSLYSSCLANT